MTLGEYIKGYRKSNDMTMDDFAKKTGLSKGLHLDAGEEPASAERQAHHAHLGNL